jgi:phosphatidylglycerophosphate synthase
MSNVYLDGIDGKQARRINLSGPLGELFDHGLGEIYLFSKQVLV